MRRNAGGKSHTRRCSSGKVRYRDHESATRALRTIQRGDRRDRTPVRVYECPECKGFHMTSSAT